MDDGTYRLTKGELVNADYRFGYLVAVAEAEALTKYPEGTLVGVWTDPRTGIVYTDISVWVRCKFDALNLARAHKQLAIWDAGLQVSVYV
jgi:hypothetical protein